MWMCGASNLDILQLTKTSASRSSCFSAINSYHLNSIISIGHSSTAPFPPHTSSIPVRTWPRHTVEKFCRSESSLTSPRYLSKTSGTHPIAGRSLPMQLHRRQLCWVHFQADENYEERFLMIHHLFLEDSRQVLSMSFHPNQNYMDWMQWSLVIQSFFVDFAIHSPAFSDNFSGSTFGLDSAVKEDHGTNWWKVLNVKKLIHWTNLKFIRPSSTSM